MGPPASGAAPPRHPSPRARERSTAVALHVVTANVNGIRTAQRRGGLQWLASCGADVLCLQEVRATAAQVDAALGAAGLAEWHHGRAGFLESERAHLDRWYAAPPEGLGWTDLGRRFGGDGPGPYTWGRGGAAGSTPTGDVASTACWHHRRWPSAPWAWWRTRRRPTPSAGATTPRCRRGSPQRSHQPTPDPRTAVTEPRVPVVGNGCVHRSIPPTSRLRCGS